MSNTFFHSSHDGNGVCVVAVGECEYFPACGKRKEWLWHKRVLVFFTGFCLCEADNFHSVTEINWVCLKHGINSGLNSWDRQLLQRLIRKPESQGSLYSLLTFSKKQLFGWSCVFFFILNFIQSINGWDDVNIKISEQPRKRSAEFTDDPQKGGKSLPCTLQTGGCYPELFTKNHRK